MSRDRKPVSSNVRAAVLVRDRGRCHLCGFGTVATAPYRHPWSPTVDHLVLSRAGGTDTPDNLAAAHWWCNSVRYCASVATARAVLRGRRPPGDWDAELLVQLRVEIGDAVPEQLRFVWSLPTAGPQSPDCRGCGHPIARTGKKGRPRVWCDACRADRLPDSLAVRSRRRRRAAARAA